MIFLPSPFLRIHQLRPRSYPLFFEAMICSVFASAVFLGGNAISAWSRFACFGNNSFRPARAVACCQHPMQELRPPQSHGVIVIANAPEQPAWKCPWILPPDTFLITLFTLPDCRWRREVSLQWQAPSPSLTPSLLSLTPPVQLTRLAENVQSTRSPSLLRLAFPNGISRKSTWLSTSHCPYLPYHTTRIKELTLHSLPHSRCA